MELALSGSLLRTFFKSVSCLAKIGAEVLIEATAGSGLTLKAMNSARSAFCSVVFKASSFDVFRVTDGTLQTAVLAKHLMAALRTQRLERIVLSQAPHDRSKIAVALECGRHNVTDGITKTYGVHCVADAEHLKATIDANAMPVKLVMRPKEFGRLLSHFQSGQNDITISCLPEEEEGGGGGGGTFGGHGHGHGHGDPPARNLKLSSFSDPNAPVGQALQTSISLDTAEDAILRYDHDSDGGPVDVTVNLKDLKAMVAFCESVDVDVALFCDHAGAPVLVRPTAEYKGLSTNNAASGFGGGGGGRFGGGGGGGTRGGGGEGGGGGDQHFRHFAAAAVDFDAELVLASMLPAEANTAAAATTTELGGGGAAASEVGGGGGGGGARGGAGNGVSFPSSVGVRAFAAGGGGRGGEGGGGAAAASFGVSRHSELTERPMPPPRGAQGAGAVSASAGGAAATSVGIPDSVDGSMSPQPSNASQPGAVGGTGEPLTAAGVGAGGGGGGARRGTGSVGNNVALAWAPGAPAADVDDEGDKWAVEESEEFVEATPPGKRRRW